MQSGETKTAIYQVRSDGIIIQKIKPQARQEIKEAQENMAMFLKLAAGQPRFLMVDLREAGPTGAGVRELYAQNTAHLIALAFLVDSALSRMIGNFFISLNRPQIPCRLFNTEPTAFAWLKTHPIPQRSTSSI